MKRYTPQEDGEHLHDLVIVGGGIYGAAMAYTAALNGIDAVLLEQDDFAQHTSANSQKVIHGGIRYLQSLDLKRVIESVKEKHRFYHLFPHQVQPLPCVLPTSGYTTQGNEAFRIAFLLYSLLEKCVCKLWFPKSTVTSPKILSRKGVTQLFPHLHDKNIRGGALWYDGLCLEPERIVVSLLKSAEHRGCKVANYMKVAAYHREENGFLRVKIYDALKKRYYQVRTRKISLCTGPWFQKSFENEEVPQELAQLSLIRGINVIVPSLFDSATSLAAKVQDGDNSRFLFIVPWKNYSLEGTYWEDADSCEQKWLNHEKQTKMFHQLHQRVIQRRDGDVPVLASHLGYVPGQKDEKKQASERVLSHYKLVEREGVNKGDVLQVVGVKFTTAFDVVCKALRKLFPDVKIEDILSVKDEDLPYGSFAGSVEQMCYEAKQKLGIKISAEQWQTFFQLFGTELEQIVREHIQPSKTSEERKVSQTELYCILTRYCIAEEMTSNLTDLVWRRLFPDHPEPLPGEIVEVLAKEMASQLGWTKEQKEEQIQLVIKGREFS